MYIYIYIFLSFSKKASSFLSLIRRTARTYNVFVHSSSIFHRCLCRGVAPLVSKISTAKITHSRR